MLSTVYLGKERGKNNKKQDQKQKTETKNKNKKMTTRATIELVFKFKHDEAFLIFFPWKVGLASSDSAVKLLSEMTSTCVDSYKCLLWKENLKQNWNSQTLILACKML